MQRILNALQGDYDILIFGDKVLEEPIETWPTCDLLISFYSTGFDLDKAIAYVKLRKPLCVVNNLITQKLLHDRRLVLHILDQIGVRTPEGRCFVNRDDGPAMSDELIKTVARNIGQPNWHPRDQSCFRKNDLVQIDNDTIKVGSHRLVKPFVEKPVDGEDHRVHVYYSAAQGAAFAGFSARLATRAPNLCRTASMCAGMDLLSTSSF